MEEVIAFGVVLGVSMAIVNTFKARIPPVFVPLCSLAISIGLNMALAWGLDYELRDAFIAAFVGAAAALGLFAGSDQITPDRQDGTGT